MTQTSQPLTLSPTSLAPAPRHAPLPQTPIVATTPPAAPARQRRRVLFVDHCATLGGGEIALFNLVTAMDPERITPIVLLFSEGPLADKLRAAGVHTEVLPLDAAVAGARKDGLGVGSALNVGRAFRAMGFVRRLAGRIRALNPDIVHTNSLKADLLGGLAARLARRKCIWHVRDRIMPDYLPGSMVKLFRRAARHVPTHVVAISEAVRETLRLPPGRVTVIHDGIPDPAQAGHLPAATDHGERLRVGIVGRISPWKGQHIFLEAAARVRENFPAAQFQIIGAALFCEHDYERQLHAQVQSLDLVQAVEFTGMRPPHEIPGLIAELDVLVHASTLGEPFGQVIVEGMIAGKPVIATRGGGVPEIVTQDTGVLIPMNDGPALAAALEQLLADAALRRRLGAAARQRVLDCFLIRHTAAKVESLYQYLAPVAE